jgi:hypothetical protein
MPKLIITFTKPSDVQNWVSTGRTEILNYFSTEEIQKVFLPYKAIIDALPGLLNRSVVSTTSTTRVIEYVFDTLENTQYAANMLFGEYGASIPEIVSFRQLMASKTATIGQTSVYSIE